MKFIIERTSVWDAKPCEEAKKETFTYLDYRTVPTIEEAKKCFWFDEWFNNGINHQEKDGMIVCERNKKYHKYTIEINSLEELLSLIEKYGKVIIGEKSNFKEIELGIEIYDDYRE